MSLPLVGHFIHYTGAGEAHSWYTELYGAVTASTRGNTELLVNSVT